jgi:hypothetical protein
MAYLCSQLERVVLIFAFLVAALVLNTASVFFVRGGGAVVIVLNYVGIVPLLVFTGFVIWRCSS